MSTRYNNGSHYENHPLAAELHDLAAHAHRVGEQQGKEEHLSAHEHSRQALEHSEEARQYSEAATTGRGVIAFGHKEIAALAYEFWQARGRPEGSPQQDWFRAVKELRSRALGHSAGPLPGKAPSTKVTGQLHQLGQSLWLDNITRGLLTSGTLQRYIGELSVTGLTSNPSIFDHAIRDTGFYDEAIRGKTQTAGKLFFELALEDLTKAADLFRPIHDSTNGVDGWVSLEVSPLLANEPQKTLEAAKELFATADRPNLFIKIPGTPQGLAAIEDATFAGIPVNVTLLFSRDQYLKAAQARMRGIEKRIKAGLNPVVHSVASLFISRWDKAVAGKEPDGLKDRLGIAIAKQAYKAYRDLLESPPWLRLKADGAAPQRLLFASTGTKDPKASDTFYIGALAAPDTVNTIPEATLLAFADHGHVPAPLPADGGDCERVLEGFARGGIDARALAEQLQREGAEAFVKSWNDLMQCIETKAQRVTAGAGV